MIKYIWIAINPEDESQKVTRFNDPETEGYYFLSERPEDACILGRWKKYELEEVSI